MSWMTEFADPAAVRERALKSFAMPMGLANPLWLAFGAAASAGAAWWLMTRWASPMNVEAMFGAAKTAPVKTPAVKALKAVETAAEKTPEATPVVLEVALEAAPAFVEAVAAPIEAALETIEAETTAVSEVVPEVVSEALAQTEAEVEAAGDDLTQLVGVGPRTAAALAERGVTSFVQLAAWTEDQMAAFDAEMKLKGRSVRDAWRAQAKRLAAQG
jgi:predicted flap endonuclease-1-like 5' DNA nuclease